MKILLHSCVVWKKRILCLLIRQFSLQTKTNFQPSLNVNFKCLFKLNFVDWRKATTTLFGEKESKNNFHGGKTRKEKQREPNENWS